MLHRHAVCRVALCCVIDDNIGVITGEGLVAAERHYDSLRAQLTAATAVGAVTGLISLGLAPLMGLNAPSVLSVESAFWAFIVASSAGELCCAVLCCAVPCRAVLGCSALHCVLC